jgi:hypothetical protein
MTIFEKIRYKNILSIGNTAVEVNLKEFSTNVILGKNNGVGKSNGCGKCLRGSTEIDIEFSDEETKRKFLAFLSDTVTKSKDYK